MFIISAAYSRIIEEFPHGGGGYVVATKLLGQRVGVVSGCALLVDYVLTITVSIAAAGDALFSFLPARLAPWRSWPVEIVCIVGADHAEHPRRARSRCMVAAADLPVFLVTHVVLIVGGICRARAAAIADGARAAATGFHAGLAAPGFGLGAMAAALPARLLARRRHLHRHRGGLQRPADHARAAVQTGKRTMLYMAISLAFTAGGPAGLLPALGRAAPSRARR